MDNNQINNKGGNGPKMNMPKFNMNWIYILAILALGLLYFSSGGPSNSSIAKTASYSDFKEMVNHGYAQKIVVNKNQGNIKMYVKPEHIRDVFHQSAQQTGKDPYVEVEFGSVDQLEEFVNKAKEDKIFTGDFVYENHKDNDFFNMIFYNLFPIFIIVLLWIFFMRRMGGGGMGAGGGVFSVGKSKAKMYEKGGDLGITFKDVAGQAGAKQEIQEIVDFLKNPQKYTELGGKIPMVRRCWLRLWLARLAYPSSRCQVPTSSRCSWVWVPLVFATSSSRQRPRVLVSSSSTRSMLWVVPARRILRWEAMTSARTR